jgi:hypothetical protein
MMLRRMAAADPGVEIKINHADYRVRYCLASVRWKQLHNDPAPYVALLFMAEIAT